VALEINEGGSLSFELTGATKILLGRLQREVEGYY
jgi:hypothetical protein